MLPIIRNRFFGLPSVVDRFFGNELPGSFDWDSEVSVPAVNIKETGTDFQIEVAAPGLKRDDFKIEVEKQVLSVWSEKQQESESKKENYTRREFCYSQFRRSFALPDYVDSDKISARHEDGVLHITLPKRDHAVAKPARKIEIK